ncbi:MAG: 4-hydroxybenzoate polyprenyltransferase [Paracoccaceae bacterium]
MQSSEISDLGPEPPLVLDIDGTLLRTDLLLETFWAAMGRNLWAALVVVVTSLASPARLKRRLRQIAEPDIALLPVRQSVLDRARAALDQGRVVCLASGADQGQVEAVARRFTLPGAHFGSSDRRNLTGAAKADMLVDRFGESGFDYAGNAWVDLKIWRHARAVIAIAPGRRLAARLQQLDKPVSIEREASNRWAFIKEMRPHQWIKNLLLLLPLIAAHAFDPGGIARVILAMAAFSLGASALYFVNDLLDLDADRRHPEKANRPIASGALPIRRAMAICLGLIIASPLLALLVSPTVAALTLAYMLSSLVYSLWLKKLVWIDLVTLVWMFLLRVVTGAAASQTDPPALLLAFVFALFLTLAAVKRITALARALHGGHLPGRGYSEAHLGRLQAVAVAGAGTALLLFLAYAFGPLAAQLYTRPVLLALGAVPLGLWLMRIIRLAGKGQEDYDPTVFVTHDKTGLALVAAGFLLAVLAV